MYVDFNSLSMVMQNMVMQNTSMQKLAYAINIYKENVGSIGDLNMQYTQTPSASSLSYNLGIVQSVYLH